MTPVHTVLDVEPAPDAADVGTSSHTTEVPFFQSDDSHNDVERQAVIEVDDKSDLHSPVDGKLLIILCVLLVTIVAGGELEFDESGDSALNRGLVVTQVLMMIWLGLKICTTLKEIAS